MERANKISAWRAWAQKVGARIRGIHVGVADVTGAFPAAPGADYGVAVTNDSAMRLTSFFAGIRLIGENVASLPKYVKIQKGADLETDYDHPVNRILAKPNEYTNVFAFWQVITTWVKGWGNAYAIIERRDGYPVALHQVHPSCVSVGIVNGRKWYKVTMTDPDFRYLDGTYPDDQMLHFMEMSMDGIVGVNTVVYNAMALGKATATEMFGAEFYKKGGNLKAVMETDGNLGDEQYEAFMRHFNHAQNFETPLLEYGIKYKPLSVDPVAAQLIQSETMSIQDIARILNVPPHMLAELSHATFSNIEHQTIQFVQYSLRPIVKKIEVELRSKLFSDSERGRYKIKFSLDGLLRGDTAARSAYYHNAILDGYMTRNEVRALEGLERIEGLDKLLYPLNSGIVGEEPQNNKEESNE